MSHTGPSVQAWLRGQEVKRWREAVAQSGFFPMSRTGDLTREELNAWADEVLDTPTNGGTGNE